MLLFSFIGCSTIASAQQAIKSLPLANSYKPLDGDSIFKNPAYVTLRDALLSQYVFDEQL